MYLVYAFKLSECGRLPVVVRDSTWATVYAFFSAIVAECWASASSMLLPCEKARFAMLWVMRATVSARCSSDRDHSCSAMSRLEQVRRCEHQCATVGPQRCLYYNAQLQGALPAASAASASLGRLDDEVIGYD